MLTINLKTDPRRLVDALRSKPQAIVDTLKNSLNSALLLLQRFIVTQKLSGQTLNRRTGILAGSVRVVPAHVVGGTIQGGIEAGGGPALYAKYFEEPGVGGTGGTRAHTIFTTRARALRFVSGGATIFAKSVMNPGTAMRPFLRPSLEENAGSIRERLQSAIDEELKDF